MNDGCLKGILVTFDDQDKYVLAGNQKDDVEEKGLDSRCTCNFMSWLLNNLQNLLTSVEAKYFVIIPFYDT